MLIRLAAQSRTNALRSGGRTFVHGSRTLATLTLYHNANAPFSVKILELLEKARTEPYPRPKRKDPIPRFPPLPFDIDLRERSPTAEEFSELLYLTQSGAYTVFLKQSISQSYKAHPTNAQSLYDMAQEDPMMIRWPILVNYEAQEIAFDQTGMKDVLRTLLHKRDGAPVPPEPPAPRWTMPPGPKAWVDYD